MRWCSRTTRPSEHLRAGDVIPQDRVRAPSSWSGCSTTRCRCCRRSARRSCRHPDALATALEGRGEQLGDNLVARRRLPHRAEPRDADDRRRQRAGRRRARRYADAAPDLLGSLRDLSVTSGDDRRQAGAARRVPRRHHRFATTTTAVLTENERPHHPGRPGQPADPGAAGRVLAEYPCFARAWPSAAAHRGGVRATSSCTSRSRSCRAPAYQPGRRAGVPVDATGPSCHGLPDPGGSQAHPYPGDDVRRRHRGGADAAAACCSAPARGRRPGPSTGTAGTRRPSRCRDRCARRAAAWAAADEVPDIAVLLWGPLVRGTW